nr:protein kinase [uncultured Chitinophaga sp.]
MINELKETHNQNVDQQHGFHHLLDEMGIPYTEDEEYLHVGQHSFTDGWILYLSVKSREVGEMVSKVCPLLFHLQIPFGVVKNTSVAGEYNDFWRGIDYVGKIMTIYSLDKRVTGDLIRQLSVLLVGMEGPQINNAVRLNENIYVARIFWTIADDRQLAPVPVTGMPSVRKMPFKVDRKYQYWKRKRLLKNRYVPLSMVVHSPKGDLLKSVDLRGWRFNWCFIKEGKKRIFFDRNGRDIKDRLKWQAQVLAALEGHINVPKVIDFFEQGEECYLVMDWLEGVDLSKKIHELRKDIPWADVPTPVQQRLITYYLKVVQMIEKMHAIGYVHRDATAANFMVMPTDEVYTIDLELSYDYKRLEPEFPFSLGAFGYVAPEQIREQPPTVKEDVFTLGSLLIHIVAGIHPSSFVSRECDLNTLELARHVPDERLMSLIQLCLEKDASLRPEVDTIKKTIETIFFN